jgi:Icc-related predicted phosphoesterase
VALAKKRHAEFKLSSTDHAAATQQSAIHIPHLIKLLAITDLHGDWTSLEQILARASPPDAILLGGDVTHFGTGNGAAEIVARCVRTCANVLAVAGNCDSPEIDRVLERMGCGLFRRGIVQSGIGFYGLSAMPQWHGDMYELTEAWIAAALAQGRQQVLSAGGAKQIVILSHPPPRDAVDLTIEGQHVGSTALREHIEQHQPALVICGHIHEARGIARIGETIVVNCGPSFASCFAEIAIDGEIQVELRQVNS